MSALSPHEWILPCLALRKAEIADKAAAEKGKIAVSAKAGPEGFSIGNSDKNNPFIVTTSARR